MPRRTTNEIIRDEIVQRQIEVMGLSRGMGQRLVRLLNKAEPELRQLIRARLERAARIGRDPGPKTTRRMQSISRQIQSLLRPSWAEIRGSMREELIALASSEVGFSAGLLGASLPVVYEPVLPNRQVLRELVTNVPIDGTPLGQLMRDWERADRARIMREVRTGLLFSETPIQISRRIFGTRSLRGTDGVRQITRRGAATLANTAASAITNEARRQFSLLNRRVVTEEIYAATLDSRTTIICASLDGNRYKVGEGPTPPLHPNCRSVRYPIVDGRRLGRRPAVEATSRQLNGLSRRDRAKRIRELVGQVPAEVNYQQWLRGRPASLQDEILGPTRGRLFRRGELELDRFVDNDGRVFNIDQLMAREPAAFRRAQL